MVPSPGPASYNPLVSTSTCEAELLAASNGAKEAFCISQPLEDFKLLELPFKLYGHNTGALGLAKNNKVHGRNKHLQVRWFLIRDLVQDGIISFNYILTYAQLADALSKPAPVNITISFMEQSELQAAPT